MSIAIDDLLRLLVLEKRAQIRDFPPNADIKGYNGVTYTPADVERALEYLQGWAGTDQIAAQAAGQQ